MKGSSVALICTVLFCMNVLNASAAGMKIGATAWYSWWDSNYVEDHFSGRSDPMTIKSNYSINPAPLYGPALSFDFNSTWSINAIFIYGSHFRPEGRFYNISDTSPSIPLKMNSSSARVEKYDLDTTLSWAVHNYCKLFLGMKYQGYGIDVSGYAIAPGSVTRNLGGEQVSSSFGPGLGIGVTIPVVDNLYILGSFSGVYLRSRWALRSSSLGYGDFILGAYGDPYTINYLRTKVNAAFNAGGLNSSLSLAYVFQKASLTLSLGGRYQLLKFSLDGLGSQVFNVTNPANQNAALSYGIIYALIYQAQVRKTLDSTLDHFYGLTFSAIYSLDFSRPK